MPATPPWPIALIIQLEPIVEELKRQAQIDPDNLPLQDTLAAFEAAKIKLEHLARSGTQG